MPPGVPRLPPGAFCVPLTRGAQKAPGGNPGACCTRTRGIVPRFAWRAAARLNQPGPPGLASAQKAPGGNPGTCCTRTRGLVPRFAWRAAARLSQPGPPGLAPAQKAPGGNPGTPGVKTIPPSMPDDGTQLPGSNPHRMAPGTACHPESPGSRRGLFVCRWRIWPRKPRVATRVLRAQKPPRLPCRTTARDAPA